MDELDVAIDLGPENEQQLAHLRRALILGSGFQLVLLEISQPDLMDEVLRRLLRWSGHDGVPALTVVKTRPGRDPVTALRSVPAGAVLVGIDRILDLALSDRRVSAIADDETVDPEVHLFSSAKSLSERSITTLNWRRDELPLLVQGPLVVIVSPDGLRELFVHAPDLFAWRAHTTRVTRPRPVDLEVRPSPIRRILLEEKAWLEARIAAAASHSGGAFTRNLPEWLIRLGEIEAHEGIPWEQRFERAKELASRRSDSSDIWVRLAFARARRALDEERYEDASSHAARAVKPWMSAISPGRLDGIPYEVLVEMMIVGVEADLRLGRIDLAAMGATTALKMIRNINTGDLALKVAALGVAAAVASYRGDYAEATSLFEEMRVAARGTLDLAAEVFALIRLIELAPDAERARLLYLEVVSITEDGDHEVRARSCLALARQELRAGNLDEAERLLSLTEPLVELQPNMVVRALVARGELATTRDQHDGALAAYRRAWEAQDRSAPFSRRHARLGVLLGEAALRAGETAVARDAYRRVAELAEILADGQLAAVARTGLDRALREGLAPARRPG